MRKGRKADARDAWKSAGFFNRTAAALLILTLAASASLTIDSWQIGYGAQEINTPVTDSSIFLIALMILGCTFIWIGLEALKIGDKAFGTSLMVIGLTTIIIGLASVTDVFGGFAQFFEGLVVFWGLFVFVMFLYILNDAFKLFQVKR